MLIVNYLVTTNRLIYCFINFHIFFQGPIGLDGPKGDPVINLKITIFVVKNGILKKELLIKDKKKAIIKFQFF